MYAREQLYYLLDRLIDNMIIILFDNTLIINYNITTLRFLTQIIHRYYIFDMEYFEGKGILTVQEKSNVIEMMLRVLAHKYKDILDLLGSIIEFYKKNNLLPNDSNPPPNNNSNNINNNNNSNN